MSLFYLLAASVVAVFLWTPVSHLLEGEVDMPTLIGALFLVVIVAGRRFSPPSRTAQSMQDLLVESRDAPWLHRLIDAACEALHIEVDVEVRLVNGFNATVSVPPRGLLPARRRPDVVLRIGYGTLYLLTRRQLQAVIVHELAHVRMGDHRAAVFVGHVQRSFERTIMTFDGSWLGGVFAAVGGWCVRRFAVVARAQEEAADRAVRHLVGAHHLAGALRRLETAEILFAVFLIETKTPMSSEGPAPSPEPYRRFAHWLRDGRQCGDQHEVRVRVWRAPTHALDSHPPTALRAVPRSRQENQAGDDGAGR